MDGLASGGKIGRLSVVRYIVLLTTTLRVLSSRADLVIGPGDLVLAARTVGFLSGAGGEMGRAVELFRVNVGDCVWGPAVAREDVDSERLRNAVSSSI